LAKVVNSPPDETVRRQQGSGEHSLISQLTDLHPAPCSRRKYATLHPLYIRIQVMKKSIASAVA